MKAHIFLFANPKFHLQILCSFGDITKNVKLNGIPENNFLCIFIIASSPGVHTFFCLWRVNKKLPQGETSQNEFQRSRSINSKWKIYMLKWAYPSLIVWFVERKRPQFFHPLRESFLQFLVYWVCDLGNQSAAALNSALNSSGFQYFCEIFFYNRSNNQGI